MTAFRRRLEIFRQSSLPMLKAMDSIGRLTIVSYLSGFVEWGNFCKHRNWGGDYRVGNLVVFVKKWGSIGLTRVSVKGWFDRTSLVPEKAR